MSFPMKRFLWEMTTVRIITGCPLGATCSPSDSSWPTATVYRLSGNWWTKIGQLVSSTTYQQGCLVLCCALRSTNLSIEIAYFPVGMPERRLWRLTFDTHDFGMKWSYAEMAVTIEGLGLDWASDDLQDCIKELVGMSGYPDPSNGTVATGPS